MAIKNVYCKAKQLRKERKGAKQVQEGNQGKQANQSKKEIQSKLEENFEGQ